MHNRDTRTGVRPSVEALDGRVLLSAFGNGPRVVHAAAPVIHRANPLSVYRVFEGVITQGPRRGETFTGPIVLGSTDARGQVVGYLYQTNGTTTPVVGGIFGSSVALRFSLPHGGAVQVVGVGWLRRVPGGLPGGMALVGSGRITAPDGTLLGTWQTVKPTS